MIQKKVLNTLFKTSDTPEVTINKDDTPEQRSAKQIQIDKRKSETGAFNRIFDNLTSGIKNIVDKSGPGSESALLRSVKSNILIDYVTSGYRSAIDKDVSEIDKRITRETERLASLEERYWKQFTALEKAMSQMNSQSSWLSQQFGGGQQ
jgi:Flagellar capping protein